MFKDYFNNEIKGQNKKFTIILGSGFHKNVLGNNHVLSSWSCLIRSIESDYNDCQNSSYLLDFERFISKSKLQGSAYKKEIDLQKKIKTCILNSQKEVFNSSFIKSYKTGIFNPKYISDIICLNFDTLAEDLFKNEYSCKKISSNLNFDLKNKSKIFKDSIKFNEYQVGENKIRFWYPHGNINRPTSIILSARKYALHISEVEKMRQLYKKYENTEDWEIP